MTLTNRLVLIIAALVILVHGEDVETPVTPQEDAVSVGATNNDRRHLEKDANASDNRQARMALHAEAPSSKAKREQALRNILAARRRQLLGSRVSDAPPKSPSSKAPRPVLGVSKDPPDMLEAQETRHGIYVTAAIGDQVSVIMDNDEDEALESSIGENFSTSERPEKIDEPPKRADNSTKSSLLIRINETNHWTVTDKKSNETGLSKNTTQILTRFQKILENENRRKNTVAMPESLYNHFRPVESNIPVEDMSQFLYFGQKLHPDIQNSSARNNNSIVDVTSTSSSVPSSRRRYSMKRFSTTTPIPVPRLEDIMNEEMNIALERSTIERNKIPKTKNVFRSPGSGTYFRKSLIRPSDPTIVSNVILTRETSRNASVLSDNKRESVLLRNSGKFAGDPSAHAHHDQVAIVSDGGSNAGSDSIAAAHRTGNVINENDSTQFRSDIAKKDERRHQRGENLSGTLIDDKTESEKFSTIKTIDESISRSSIERDYTNTEMASTSRNELINGITTWQSVDSNHEFTNLSENIKSDNDARMTSSTSNDLESPFDSRDSLIIPTTTTNLASTSLRIVVTEPVAYTTDTEERLFNPKGEGKEANEREFNVKEKEDKDKNGKNYRNEVRGTVDRSYSTRNRTVDELGDYKPSPEYSKITVFTSTNPSRVVSSTEDSSEDNIPATTIRRYHNSHPLPINVVPESAKTEKTEYKQQHVYAYEITNVTRLLRNYTGPGLNIAVEQQVTDDKRRKESGRADQPEKEEEEKRKRMSNKKEKKLEDERMEEKEKDETAVEGDRRKEVERGSALTRTNAGSIPEIRNVGGSVQPTPQRQQPLPLLLPTPRREASSRNSGGKVEPARTTGQLSAGTDVDEVTASGSVESGVGDRSGSGGGGSGGGGGGGGGGGSDIETGNTSPPAFPTFATSKADRVSSEVPEVHTSTTSLPKTTRNVILDGITESTILTSTRRWNHTGFRVHVESPEISGNDRRYLRKSASAVLNQRTIEDGLAKEVKRRRGSSSSLFAFSFNNGRNKGWRNGVKDDYPRSSVSRSMENRTALPDNENALSEGTEKFSEVSDIGESMMEMRTETGYIDRISETEKILLEAATTALPPSTLESPVKKSTSDLTGNSSTIETLTIKPASNSSSPIIETVVANGITNNKLTSALSTEPTLRSVAIGKSVDVTLTTGASPGFPVTPRMLVESSESVRNDEIGSVNETKSEANRPFGLAKDLDPSEIQKMYRSQTTLRPELIVTTIIPESERSTDENPASVVEQQPQTPSTVNSSITRSPEVRGRNLSDKSKDKDDVLPIMELYNTSNIFNGTEKDSEDYANFARTTLQPLDINETRHELASATTIETAPTPTTDDLNIGQTPSIETKDEHWNDSTEISKKNNKHGVDRDYTNDSAIPTKSSNFTNHENSFINSTQSNKTKHRPSYHQTPPPEFIGYRPEFNSSYFEPGMISVSPREMINISEVITKRHDGDTIATQETVAIVSYILATLVVFPIAVGVGLILRRLIIKNRKVLEESDTSSEISCRKDALNLENGDFKTSIEKAITKLPRIQHLCHEAEKPPPPPSQESRWEFPRDKLRLQTVLGQGNFGQVWKAEADDLTGHQGTTRLVAVKTVKEGASAREKEDLVRELEIMQQLGNHPNVVTLLGCCTEEEPHYLILEYVMYGKLLAYLRDHRTRQDFYNFSEDSAALTSRDLTVFGYCVARGMEYLASKKIIHRDLAARNVLVDHNKLCKIADFGMSRFANDDGEVIEARHGRNALPIRWMAPESLIYSLFTTKTDVWSFGILMWEIVTLGSTPYPDMAAREVMRNVQNGYRLERPSHCHIELFRVVSRCWHADPDRRPEFQTLRRDMAQLLEDGMNGHYVDLESFASECTD